MTRPGNAIDPPSTQGSPLGGWDAASMALIVAAVLIVGASGIGSGGLGWSDAPNHVFDGIFVLEFLREMPLDNPREWAEQFYVRHPTLGIIVYWPPGFAVVEALVFALFGVSIATARATVLLFAAGAGCLMFGLGKRWFDRPTGLFAALLLITCPHGGLWLNDVMLEWPALFWILASLYAYQADRDTGRARWTLAMAAAVAMAFFTKQTAGFILPVILLHALISRDRLRYLCRPVFVVGMAASAGVIAAYVWLTRGYTALPAQLLELSLDLSEVGRWPPEIIGWPLLPVALLGLGTFILEPNRGARGLLLIWFACWTAFSLLIAAKEPRYLFFSIPPLAFTAVRFFLPYPAADRREQRLALRHDAPRLVLLAVLVLVQVILVRTKSTGRLPDYAPAVAELANHADADLVLVDAVRDGQFVFDLYQSPDAAEKIIPLRASKILYARAARMKYSPQISVQSEQDIVDILDRHGIRYIVIESALPRTHYLDADPPPRRLLRHLLSTDPRFVLVEKWPLRCGDPIWDDVELHLYTYPECPPRTSNTVTLPFPAMGGEVTFELP